MFSVYNSDRGYWRYVVYVVLIKWGLSVAFWTEIQHAV